MKTSHPTTIKTVAALFSYGLLISAPLVQAAETFPGFSMNFVDIGNAGNAADNTGYGAVGHNYKMGVNEVSRGMINAYNGAVDGGPDISLYDMTSYGGNGANRPATGVSWNEAARFVNWLNTSQGHAEAYKFTTSGANDNIALWTGADAGYDASNPFRNSNAHYFLPSEDEWYKAAYYDPNASTYYNYATGSDTVPAGIDFNGDTTFDAVFYDGYNQNRPNDITNAGVLSPYGTMAQNGNVWEWGESGYTAPNDTVGESRVFRGGSWGAYSSSGLQSSYRYAGGSHRRIQSGWA